MKTYILVAGTLIALVAFVALAHTTLAAGSGGKCESLTGLEKIGVEVGATDEQKAQISTIISGAVAEEEAVKGNEGLSADAQHKQLREIQRTAHQAVFAVRRYEDASLRYTGIESHEGLTHYGLYDTVVARE